MLRCYPSDQPKLPVRGGGGGGGELSTKRMAEDDDVPSLIGAMFDGAGDAKPRLFDVTSSSGVPLSTIDRPSRKKPKPERIEIHNSNVHIYNTNQQGDEFSKHRHRRRRSKRYADSFYGISSSDPTSPRACIAAHQAGSSYNRTYSGISPSPALQLRGGAPGSYTASPTNDKPSNDVWEISPGAYQEENTEWTSNAFPPIEETENNGAKEENGWKNDTGDQWANSDVQGKKKAWDPVTNPTEKRNEWGEIIKNPEVNDNGANVTRDPTTNSSEQRGRWGEDTTEDKGKSKDTSGTTAWTSYADNADKDCGGWNADFGGNGKGWGSDDAEQKDHNQQSAKAWGDTVEYEAKKDAANSSSWNNTISREERNEPWGASKKDPEEASLGASASADLSAKDPWESGKPENRPPMPSAIGKGKNVKAGPARSKRKNPPVSILKTSTKKKEDTAKTPLAATSVEEKPTTMPGSWSPPPMPSQSKEQSEQQQETVPVPPSQAQTQAQTIPIHSIAKPPNSRPYWATWNNATTPDPTPPVTSEPDPDDAIFPCTEEEPIYTIPSTLAAQQNLTHQVRPMRGSAYSHRLSSPKYMDTHDDPYAVFVFKYRDQVVIEQMLGRKVESTDVEEKQRLKGLSKEEIIEELLKARAGMGNASLATIPAVGIATTPTAGVNGTLSTEQTPEIGRWATRGKVPPMPPAEDSGSGSRGNSADDWGRNPKGAGAWKSLESGKGCKTSDANANKSRTNNNSTDQEGDGWGDNGRDDGGDGGNDEAPDGDDWKDNDAAGQSGAWGNYKADAEGGDSGWGNSDNRGNKGWGNDQNGGTGATGGGDGDW